MAAAQVKGHEDKHTGMQEKKTGKKRKTNSRKQGTKARKSYSRRLHSNKSSRLYLAINEVFFYHFRTSVPFREQINSSF